MREIKFRGKDSTLKKWLYGDLLQYNDGSVCIGERSKTFTDDGYQNPFYSTVLGVDEETICQFTGLHDKNGKPIYEGDIVKAPLLDPIFGDIIKDTFCNSEIIFNKGSFVVSYYKRDRNIYLSDLYDKIEVIGNIFDNKELLNED